MATSTIVFGVYTLYSAWQWRTHFIKSWDVAIFTQLFQRYAALEAPVITAKGDPVNLLGDHFHPLLAIFTPIFALAPHPFTLLLIQNACFAVAAGIVTASGRRHAGPVTGVVLGLAFGLSWGLQFAVEAQFHEIALGVPLLTASLAAVLNRHWRAAVLWAMLLVFVKEDLGLTVAAIGCVIILYRVRKPGCFLVVWGLGWLILTVTVIIPAFNGSGDWTYSDSVDVVGVLSNPELMFHPGKGLILALLLLTTSGLIVRSPLALILIPTLGWRFMSTNEAYWGLGWHYNAMLMPVAFLACIDGIRRCRAAGDKAPAGWAGVAPWVAAVVAIGIVVAPATGYPQAPLQVLLTPGAYRADPRAATVAEILAAIPAGASVESDVALMNYVVANHRVYWIGSAPIVPDCILTGDGGGTPTEWGDAFDTARLLHPQVQYELLVNKDGYSLACRAEPGDQSPLDGRPAPVNAPSTS